MEIDVRDLHSRLSRGERLWLLDVRQPEEHAYVALPGSTLIPLAEMPNRLKELEVAGDRLVVAYCHHGVRSLMAAWYLRQQGVNCVSLRGGIDAWSAQVDPSLPRYV
jgi:rhodanese-related sulfurtransferase